MAASFQKYICIGNLTKEPELRHTPNGTAVCEFTVAVNGARREDPTFYAAVTAFGKTAEACNRYLAKGVPVLVEGRLQTDEWEDRQSGQKRTKTRVIAEGVQFIGSRSETQQRGQTAQNSAPSAPATNYGAPRPAAPRPAPAPAPVHKYPATDAMPTAPAPEAVEDDDIPF